MKYFTPERLIRLQDRSSREKATLAMEDWERAAEEYSAHLQGILADLPKGLAQFVQSSSLHDANVLAMWTERKRVLRIIVQKERDSSHIVDLNYRLVEPARINSAALPEAQRSTSVLWLYDELHPELNGTEPVFRHEILLSNGCEVVVRFHRLTVRRYPAVEAAFSSKENCKAIRSA